MIAVISKIVPKIMVPVPIIAVLSKICWVSVKSWIVSTVKNKPIARKIQPGIPYSFNGFSIEITFSVLKITEAP